jgi:hypothetical protein
MAKERTTRSPSRAVWQRLKAIAALALAAQILGAAFVLAWWQVHPATARRHIPALVEQGLRATGLAAPLLATLKSQRAERDNVVVWSRWGYPGPAPEVWGYADRHSVPAGEPFAVMLSTGPDDTTFQGKVEIFRIGHYGSADRRLVWTSDLLTVRRQEVEATAAAIGASWPPAIERVPTDGWRSGYYTIDFVRTPGARTNDIAYIVVVNPELSGDILVKLGTNTYQAYNRWGGASLYASFFAGGLGHGVSFDRPTPAMFFLWDYYFVTWIEALAEQEGFSVDYATNFDLHSDPRFALEYKLLIDIGHDEYWSKEEFDHIYERIFGRGGNTLFLGANMAYWQVRFTDVNGVKGGADRGRQMLCFKLVTDPVRYRLEEDPALHLATMFRADSRRPETMLMGVAYQSWFGGYEYDPVGYPKVAYPYYVKNSDFPFFEDTGYRAGDEIGRIVGYEWDNRDPDGDGKRLWHPERSRIPLLPAESIQVVFEGEVTDWEGKPSRAEAVYFESNAGAKVFSAGTIRWAWGLGKPGYEEASFKLLNRNLIRYFLQ